jgi:hypothetical protein
MNKTTEKLYPLTNGRNVPMSLLSSVHKQVNKRIPNLSKDGVFTADMICGADYWNGLPNSKKREAGMILFFLSEHDLVPLDMVTPRDKKPYWYRLK